MLVGLVIFAAVVIPIAAAAANSPMHRVNAERFARRQMVVITAFNGSHILRYLQVTQRWRWMGTSAGLVALPLTMTANSFNVSPYFPVTGWFLGVMAGELAFGRAKSRIRRPLGMRLAPPTLAVVWGLCAAISCGMAFSTVARSSWEQIGAGQRLGAVATLAAVVVVQAMVTDLHRRALPSGPADLVGAELATRSRSARSLMAAGAVVALWTSTSALPDPVSDDVTVLGLPIVFGLPILAWIKGIDSWQVRTSAKGQPWAWAAAGAALAGGTLYVGLTIEAAEPARGSNKVFTTSASQPFPYARVNPAARAWVLMSRDEYISADRAALTVPGDRWQAPFAFSGDGRRIVYLDKETHRLVLRDLSEPGPPRDLTGPLSGGAAPGVTLSADGRYVSIGAELIDTATGSRVRLPGVGRVLGLGPGGVVATTGRRALPGAPDGHQVAILRDDPEDRGEKPVIYDLDGGSGVHRLPRVDRVAGWTDAGLVVVTSERTDRLPGHVTAATFTVYSPQGKAVRTFTLPGNLAEATAPSPSGRLLASLVREITPDDVADLGIALTDTSSGKPVRTVVPRMPAGWRIREILRWDGEDALVVQSRGTYHEIAYHVVDLATGGVRPLAVDMAAVTDMFLRPAASGVVVGSVRQ